MRLFNSLCFLINALAFFAADADLPHCAKDLASDLLGSINERLYYVSEGTSAEVRAAQVVPRYVDRCGASQDAIRQARELILADAHNIIPNQGDMLGVKMCKLALQHGFDKLDELAQTTPFLERPTPIDFWRGNPAYAVAWPVVKFYLSLPSGTEEVERVFSDSAFLQDPRQSRLDAKKFEDMVLFRRFSRLPQFDRAEVMNFASQSYADATLEQCTVRSNQQ